MSPIKFILAVVLIGTLNSPARGAAIKYSSLALFIHDEAKITTIDFVSLAISTIVTTQYAPLGIRFTDGNEIVIDGTGFTSDQKALKGNVGAGTDATNIVFDAPITAFGAMFPGALRIMLFSGGTMVGDSGQFGSAGSGFFGGLISDTPFDRVILSDPVDNSVTLDNVYYSSLPETAGGTVLSLIVFAMFAGTNRR